MPSVRFPVRWSAFWTMETLMPGEILERTVPSIAAPYLGKLAFDSSQIISSEKARAENTLTEFTSER